MSATAPAIEEAVATLKADVERLKLAEAVQAVPVQTFAPEPYDLIRPLVATVRVEEDGCSAAFAHANLTAYGDNEQEAVENLKHLLLDTFDKFSSGVKLGPGPRNQLAVLRDFIRRKG